MLNWFQNNIGTIIVLIVLAAVIGAAVFAVVRDKKRGKSFFGGSCSGGCGNCPMHGKCHPAAVSESEADK